MMWEYKDWFTVDVSVVEVKDYNERNKNYSYPCYRCIYRTIHENSDEYRCNDCNNDE